MDTDDVLVQRLRTALVRFSGGPEADRIQTVQQEVLRRTPQAIGEPFGRNDCVVLTPAIGAAWRIPLRALPVTVGRGAEADYTLADEGVSRLHCRLEREGPFVVLRDVASANGTRVNGERIAVRQLRVGDVIALGETQLTVGRG